MRRLDLGAHLGEPEQHRLVLGDLLAECLPLLRVGTPELEGTPGDPAATGGDVDATDLDAVHHLVEAAARLAAEHLVGADLEAVEDELGRVDALVTHLVDLAGHREPGLAPHRSPAGFSTRNVDMFL